MEAFAPHFSNPPIGAVSSPEMAHRMAGDGRTPPRSSLAPLTQNTPFLIRRPGPTVAATTSAPAAQSRAAGPAYRSTAMPPVSLPAGLVRVFESSKVWTALGALAIVIASVVGLDPDKATKVVAAVVSVAVTIIAATGYEDGQEKGAIAQNGAPQVTINPAPAAQTTGGTPVPQTIAKLLLLLLVPTLLLCGCKNVTPPAQSYTDADSQTFDAVAPEYQTYVYRDPSLTATQTARRENTLQTWSLRLRSAGETPATLPSTQPATGN
jgi:hypothetical protein